MPPTTKSLPITKCNLCDGVYVGKVEIVNDSGVQRGVAICEREGAVVKIQDEDIHPVDTEIMIPDWCPLDDVI